MVRWLPHSTSIIRHALSMRHRTVATTAKRVCACFIAPMQQEMAKFDGINSLFKNDLYFYIEILIEQNATNTQKNVVKIKINFQLVALVMLTKSKQ